MGERKKVSNKRSLSLVLDERFVAENIVTSFVYELETSYLVLKLGRKHENITIISSLALDDEWKRNVEELQKNLTLKGVKENHTHMIYDTVDKNAVRISDYAEGREEQEQTNGKADGKRERRMNEGKGDLYEDIIYAGKPASLMYAGFSPEEINAVREFLYWLHESELGKEITSYESEPFHLSLLAQKAIAAAMKTETGEGLI
jgi:hypothetical protein